MLSGTDKDALQSIFRSLQNELDKMAREMEDLKSRMKEQNR